MGKEKEKNLVGTYIANKKGFGFVEVEGVDEDYFIPEKYSLGAFHKDMVRISILPKKRGRRCEGKVTKVLEHGIKTLVGTFERSGSFGFVRPDNIKITRDIYIQKGCELSASDGDKVICLLTDYGSVNKGPAGRIVEVLGGEDEPYVDIISMVKAYDIPIAFPGEVKGELKRINKKIDMVAKRGRLDFTKELIISIDGDDSKDLDDAISLTKKDGIYTLGVHIADVSHYVREHTALDKEALKRGTSVYLTDVVIPMLPKAISNGICSLLEGEKRLALSCVMDIDAKGDVVSHLIKPSVIVNKRRMTYRGVNEILANPDSKEAVKNRDVMPMLYLCRELFFILNKKRIKRGAIDFDIPEAKITLDKNGVTKSISARERGVSERIIEEFMLAANETVAKEFADRNIPFVYRCHEKPAEDKIRDLADLCALYGVSFRPAKKGIKPKDIQKIITETKGTDKEAFMASVTLRSMQQARYSNLDSFHFGLAAPFYCHFTSPIRRYPDLIVHRIIKENLKRPMNKRRFEHYEKILPQVADKSSKMERRAAECEREVDKLKKCQYMLGKLGEIFTGTVSGVTSYGMYVMLDDTVEGMIPMHKMKGDRFICHEKTYEIIGEHTGRRYGIGDRIEVIVDKVDTYQRTIDFRMKNE